MKNLLYPLLLCLLFTTQLKAQTTITATGYPASTNPLWPGATHLYTQSCTPPCAQVDVAVTFSVSTSAVPVVLQSVGYSAYLVSGYKLYYSTSSLTGATGNIPTTWTLLQTIASAPQTYPTINNNFFSNINLPIPASTTYRFAVVSTDCVLYGSSYLSPGTITSNGVTLNVTNTASVVGLASNAATNSNGGYYGSITFSDCMFPQGLAATNILASSANLSWSSVAGSTGYEYIVDQNPTYVSGTPLSGTATSYIQNGLSPSTNYFLHVRNVCSPTSKSGWSNFPFTTAPPCSAPTNINVTNLTQTSATINWDAMFSALTYDYMVDQSINPPSGSAGFTNTSNTSKGESSLTAGTTYYIHLRTNCATEQTGWALDSFITPVLCNEPVIQISHINSDEAVAYWEPVYTARSYEYAVTKSEASPTNGTTDYLSTSVLVSALSNVTEYYIHVRTNCDDRAETPQSTWAKANFKTLPSLSVNSLNIEGVAIFPNPAKDVLTVLTKSFQNASVSITDISGKVLHRIPLQKTETRINISSLTPGIYMLRYSDDTHNKSMRMIKE